MNHFLYCLQVYTYTFHKRRLRIVRTVGTVIGVSRLLFVLARELPQTTLYGTAHMDSLRCSKLPTWTVDMALSLQSPNH